MSHSLGGKLAGNIDGYQVQDIGFVETEQDAKF